MAIKVTLTNSARITRSTPIFNGNKLTFPRHIYQRLSSLVNNKTILADYTAGTLPKEYIAFLDELNKVNTDDETAAINELNLYLGSLGLTEEYPYGKDIVNITPWFEAESTSHIRNIVYGEYNIVNGEDNIIRINNG